MGEKCAQSVREAQRRIEGCDSWGEAKGLAVCAESEAKNTRLGRDSEVCGSWFPSLSIILYVYYYGSSKVDEIENPFSLEGGVHFKGHFPWVHLFTFCIWMKAISWSVNSVFEPGSHSPSGKTCEGNGCSADGSDVTGSGNRLVFECYLNSSYFGLTEGESVRKSGGPLELFYHFY